MHWAFEIQRKGFRKIVKSSVRLAMANKRLDSDASWISLKRHARPSRSIQVEAGGIIERHYEQLTLHIAQTLPTGKQGRLLQLGHTIRLKHVRQLVNKGRFYDSLVLELTSEEPKRQC